LDCYGATHHGIRATQQDTRVYRSQGPGSDETLYDVGGHSVRARNDSSWNQIVVSELIARVCPGVSYLPPTEAA